MKIVGILNMTPDSFYDQGRWFDKKAAVERGLQLFSEGADIVEVGGESVRPGAANIPADVQIERTVDVIAELANAGPVSIDTRSADVARAAVNSGASLINEVGGSLYTVAGELGVGYVATHIQGEPATMNIAPHYDDVATEVKEYLVEIATKAKAAGVSKIWLDPGVGMGKAPEHNFTLLKTLPDLVSTGLPVFLAVSRKGIVGQMSGQADVQRRLGGSLATVAYGEDVGVDTIRVHDVRETREFLNFRAALRKESLGPLPMNLAGLSHNSAFIEKA